MGGPSISQSTLDTQNEIGQAQLSLANQENQQSQANRATMQSLQQPLITQQTALASGDPTAALAASMPAVSQLSAGFNASKENIMSNVPKGPAQDAALANLEAQKNTSIAGYEAQQVQNAPSILANVGSGVGAFSIQQLGAALSGLQGAGTTNNQLMQSQVQQQAAKLGLAGSLFGAAGEAASALRPTAP